MTTSTPQQEPKDGTKPHGGAPKPAPLFSELAGTLVPGVFLGTTTLLPAQPLAQKGVGLFAICGTAFFWLAVFRLPDEHRLLTSLSSSDVSEIYKATSTSL